MYRVSVCACLSGEFAYSLTHMPWTRGSRLTDKCVIEPLPRDCEPRSTDHWSHSLLNSSRQGAQTNHAPFVSGRPRKSEGVTAKKHSGCCFWAQEK